MKRITIWLIFCGLCAILAYSGNAEDVIDQSTVTPMTFTVGVKADDGTANFTVTSAVNDTSYFYRPWAFNTFIVKPVTAVTDSFKIRLVIEGAISTDGTRRVENFIYAPIDSFDVTGATQIANPPTTVTVPNCDWIRVVAKANSNLANAGGVFKLYYNRGVSPESVR